jgi:hypothetical protein
MNQKKTNNMKELINAVIFVLFPMIYHAQALEEAGTFQEGYMLSYEDSILLSELISEYKIDTTGFVFVEMFGDFELSRDLCFGFKSESYTLEITDGKKEFYFNIINSERQELNKYIMITCHSFYNGLKNINISIF